MRNQQACLQNLENHVGQIVKLLSERQQGSLLSNIEANPWKHLKAITLSSGKQVEMRNEIILSKEKEPVVQVQDEPLQEKGATPFLEKSVLHLVKEYVPWLLYYSRLKKDHTDKQFKCS